MSSAPSEWYVALSAKEMANIIRDFRQIRLRLTGKESSGYDYLTVGAFELFGSFRTSWE
jgi:hypothetical protein